MDDIKKAIQKTIIPYTSKFTFNDAKDFNEKTNDYLKFLDHLIKKHTKKEKR